MTRGLCRVSGFFQEYHKLFFYACTQPIVVTVTEINRIITVESNRMNVSIVSKEKR